MTEQESPMVRKIRALFSKVNDQAASEAERNAAEAKASELMLKHMISEHDLAEPAEFGKQKVKLPASGPRSRRLWTLMNVIAKAHGARTTGYGMKGWTSYDGDSKVPGKFVITVWGRASTIPGVVELFWRLHDDCLSAASEIKATEDDCSDEWESKGAATRRMRLSFIEGYSSSVASRLAELGNTMDDQADGGLLPVLASDGARANAMIGDVASARPVQSAYGAREQGRAAGNRANLASGSMPAGRKAITA